MTPSHTKERTSIYMYINVHVADDCLKMSTGLIVYCIRTLIRCISDALTKYIAAAIFVFTLRP